MKNDMLSRLEGYDDIAREIEISRKFGDDFSGEKGTVAAFIHRLHPKRLLLKVSEIVRETPTTHTLRLVSPEGWLPPFQAGQYIACYLTIGAIRTSRPYSIASSPSEKGHWDITIRRVAEGLVSNYLLDEVKIGDTIECSGPEGTFHFNPILHDDHLVLLGGGSGITPLMSMIRDTIARGLERRITLLYGNRSLEDVIFHEELQEISEKHANFQYVPVIEDPPPGFQGETGYLSADLIEEVSGGIEGKSFFVCGPQAMYRFVLPELEKLRIPRRKIRREMFGPPLHIWEYPGWPETVNKDALFNVKINGQEPYTASAGQSLLTMLEQNGLVIPSACRSGQCSLCRVKIQQGQVFQPAGTPVRQSDRKYGYVHSCVSYPLTDLEILL